VQQIPGSMQVFYQHRHITMSLDAHDGLY